jgi:hypothetical protein
MGYRIMIALGWMIPLAAQPVNPTRGIVPEEFVRARPAKSTKLTPPLPNYRPAGRVDPAGAAASAGTSRQVGVTIWRLRPSRPADTGARILVQEESKQVEWTPERLGSSDRLRVGEQVRLTIESASDGFLYVVDRERYGSRETGDAYLIFPTMRTRNGDNRVRAGALVDVPGQQDQPNYFTLRQNRPEHTGEELLVLITEKPIPGLDIGSKPLLLTKERVAEWERQWTSRSEIFEFTGGAGRQWTRAEQEAAANPTRLLTQDEAPPQTIYRVAARAGQPAMLRLELRMEPKR